MYEKILIAVDGSPTSDLALAEAIRLARLTGARLRLVNVLDDPTCVIGWGRYPASCTAGLLQGLKEVGERILHTARAAAEAGGVEADTTLVENIGGRVSDSVLDEAKRSGTDLIVVGTHGRRGARRLVLGSDAERISRAAPVPVLLVRSAEAQATADALPDAVIPSMS